MGGRQQTMGGVTLGGHGIKRTSNSTASVKTPLPALHCGSIFKETVDTEIKFQRKAALRTLDRHTEGAFEVYELALGTTLS